MSILSVTKHIDHTLLDPKATEADIKELCDQAIEFQAASVCVPPAHVEYARNYLSGRVAVCTVIGFPNGYSTTETKVFEAQDALEKGADEIDMVINIGKLKENDWTYVGQEIQRIKEVVGDKILKVIIESSELTDEEKARATELVVARGADYVKTSTGFASGGATLADAKILVETAAGRIKVKASGGVSDIENAQEYLDLGVDRIGASSIIRNLAKNK